MKSKFIIYGTSFTYLFMAIMFWVDLHIDYKFLSFIIFAIFPTACFLIKETRTELIKFKPNKQQITIITTLLILFIINQLIFDITLNFKFISEKIFNNFQQSLVAILFAYIFFCIGSIESKLEKKFIKH
jgi:hypothetical protein